MSDTEAPFSEKEYVFHDKYIIRFRDINPRGRPRRLVTHLLKQRPWPLSKFFPKWGRRLYTERTYKIEDDERMAEAKKDSYEEMLSKIEDIKRTR